MVAPIAPGQGPTSFQQFTPSTGALPNTGFALKVML
jgi:hypothetical protein